MNSPTTSATATITSVDTKRAFIVHLGNVTTSVYGASEWQTRFALTNATTITATRPGGGSYNVTAYFCVVEINDEAVRIQKIQFVLAATCIADAASSGTKTITAVDPTRTLLIPLGFDNQTGGSTPTELMTAMTLTNSTTITFYRQGTPNIHYDAGVAVVEFAA